MLYTEYVGGIYKLYRSKDSTYRLRSSLKHVFFKHILLVVKVPFSLFYITKHMLEILTYSYKIILFKTLKLLMTSQGVFFFVHSFEI